MKLRSSPPSRGLVSILLSFCSLSSLPIWESVPVCGLEPHECPYRPVIYVLSGSLPLTAGCLPVGLA
nr:MAG TPA: hypothetical protein [Caudoviricetes sp.]